VDYASLWRHATNLEQELLNSTTALDRVRTESAQNRAVSAAQDAAALAAAEAANKMLRDELVVKEQVHKTVQKSNYSRIKKTEKEIE
jgi:hypothetical protein